MATHKVTRCHYEILELERTATNADIKSQYYKLARQWHPDKNIGNEEEAELKFKEYNKPMKFYQIHKKELGTTPTASKYCVVVTVTKKNFVEG